MYTRYIHIYFCIFLPMSTSCCPESKGGKVLFTKGAESAILPFATGGEMEKTRLHVDEFALVRYTFFCVIYVYVVSILLSSILYSITAMLHIRVVVSRNSKFWYCITFFSIEFSQNVQIIWTQRGYPYMFPTLDEQHISHSLR